MNNYAICMLNGKEMLSIHNVCALISTPDAFIAKLLSMMLSDGIIRVELAIRQSYVKDNAEMIINLLNTSMDS